MHPNPALDRKSGLAGDKSAQGDKPAPHDSSILVTTAIIADVLAWVFE